MFTNFQTVKRIGRFRTNRESSDDGSVFNVDTDSEGCHQTEYSKHATEFGTSLYEKTETEYNNENGRGSAQKEFGDSDDESGQEGETSERSIDDSFCTFTTLDENDSREKSPGFDDFFRINEDDIQYNGREGQSYIVSNDYNNTDGIDISDNGILHPTKWIFSLPDTAIAMEEMLTSNYKHVKPTFTEMLT